MAVSSLLRKQVLSVFSAVVTEGFKYLEAKFEQEGCGGFGAIEITLLSFLLTL
jgi:hypothetical protein